MTILKTTTLPQLRQMLNRNNTNYKELIDHAVFLKEEHCLDLTMVQSLNDLILDIEIEQDRIIEQKIKKPKKPKRIGPYVPDTRKKVRFPKIETLTIENINFNSTDLINEAIMDVIEKTLAHYDGNRRLSAKALGISLRGVLNQLDKYNISEMEMVQ